MSHSFSRSASATAKMFAAAVIMFGAGLSGAARADEPYGAAPIRLAQAPQIKVIGCELGFGPQAPGDFKKCLDKAIEKLNDDLSDAKKAAKAAQQQLQKPWVAAINKLDVTPLTNCLSGKGIDLSQQTAAAAQNPAEFARARFVDLWQKGMASPAAINQWLAAFPPGGPAPTPTRMIDQAELFLAQLASQDPAGQCLWSFIQPYRAQAKATALQIYPAAKSQFDATIENQIKPAVNQATIAVLRPIVRQFRQAANVSAKGLSDGTRMIAREASVAIPEPVRLIAVGQAQRYLLDPAQMAALSAQVNSLAGGIQSGNSVMAATALASIEKTLPPLQSLSDQLALDVGIETLRYYGHGVIDEKLPPIIESIDSMVIKAASVAVAGVVTGIVALFYEPAEAISEVVADVVVIALGMTAPAVELALMSAAHRAYDEAVNAAHRALREKKPPSTYLTSAGPFGDLLRDFPSEVELMALAIPELQQMRNVLATYHQSVLGLSRAASRQAGGR